MAEISLVKPLAFVLALLTNDQFPAESSNEEIRLRVPPNGNSQQSLNLKCPDQLPRTCKNVKSNQSRAIEILSEGLEVLCDTETDGGGWVVIQRRLSGDVDFYRNWTEYKYGFGNISGNYWFGNEKIHRLTFQRRYELRVDLTFNGSNYYAVYSHFRLFGEYDNYRLNVGGYSGNAGDSLTYHKNRAFSTYDRDNVRLNETVPKHFMAPGGIAIAIIVV